ncbi:MAG: hypothetical protein Q4E72_05925 [bacterium]|nr:hypothetical protein [bacterium]
MKDKAQKSYEPNTKTIRNGAANLMGQVDMLPLEPTLEKHKTSELQVDILCQGEHS